MKNELDEQQVNTILKALEEVLEKGPWMESNFLRVIGKNLQQIRDNLTNKINSMDIKEKEEQRLSRQELLRQELKELFIALYSTEGNYMSAWERVLANIPRQMISRPIYDKEEDVRYVMKSKENKINEAYVAVFVHKSDILMLPSDKQAYDKFGKPLISLKDRSIQVENISRFVHISGVYNYVKGRLVKVGPSEF